MKTLSPLEKEMAVRGVSRSDVARAAGVDRSFVTNFLRGRRKSVKVAETLAHLIQWTPNDVITHIPQPQPEILHV